MPKSLDTGAALVDYVAHTPGAIGYIDESTPHEETKGADDQVTGGAGRRLHCKIAVPGRYWAMRACHSAGPVWWTLVPLASTATVTGMSTDFELVDGFHAEVGEGEDACALDGLGDEVGGAADGDEVDGFELADGVDGCGAAFGFADHAEQAGLGEHLAGELVHARGGGGAGGADGFVADGFDGADVVDEAAFEVDGELFAAGEHVGEALVGGVAAGEELAGEQDDFAGLPGLDVVVGDGVEIDAAGVFAAS